MTTSNLFKREFDLLMCYNRSDLIEIAAFSYGLNMAGDSKEAIASACATIEVSNYVR